MVWFFFKEKLESKADDKFGKWRLYQFYSVLRFLEVIAGIVTLSLYIQDLGWGKPQDSGSTSDPNANAMELFATIVGMAAAASALLLGFPFLGPKTFFWWDCLVALCYTVIFGVYCSKYANQTDAGITADLTDKETRLHHAMYVDAAAMALWVTSAAFSTTKFARRDKCEQGPESGYPDPGVPF